MVYWDITHDERSEEWVIPMHHNKPLFNCYTQRLWETWLLIHCSLKSHFGHSYLEAHCESHAAWIMLRISQGIQGTITEALVLAFYSDFNLEPREWATKPVRQSGDNRLMEYSVAAFPPKRACPVSVLVCTVVWTHRFSEYEPSLQPQKRHF